MSVKFTKGVEKQAGNPSVHVTYIKPQAEFDVSFHKDHLNVDWNLEYDKLSESEGLMGKSSRGTYTHSVHINDFVKFK